MGNVMNVKGETLRPTKRTTSRISEKKEHVAKCKKERPWVGGWANKKRPPWAHRERTRPEKGQRKRQISPGGTEHPRRGVAVRLRNTVMVNTRRLKLIEP